MTNLDNLATIEINDQPPSTVENPIKPSVVQLKNSDEPVRKRKLMWIVMSATIIIIVIALVIMIPLVFVGKKKMNTNASITIVSTIITTTSTTTLRTTTITTTQITTTIDTEVLPHNSTINDNSKWKQTGMIIAGGHGKGDELDQLSWPISFYIDDDYQAIYISDCDNHRVMEWEFNATTGRIVAGGNEEGNETNQLACPAGVIIDKETNSMIICDRGNKRIVRWSRQNNMNGDIIISDYACFDVTMDKDGYLYVVNDMKSEVTRWKIGDDHGVIVAGGNGDGPSLDQFSDPSYVFVDENYSLYISDSSNSRVMKWMKGEKEGIIIAGALTEESTSVGLGSPFGITVDQLGNVYVVDTRHWLIIRWIKGATEGTVIIYGNEENQFLHPMDLSFDRYGNLYVLDASVGGLFKFLIDSN